MTVTSRASDARIAHLAFKVAKNPTSALFLPLADAYRQQGQLDEAERVLRAGLDLHPHHYSARTALGRVLVALGRREEARVELERAVRGAPENLLARSLLAGLTPREPAPPDGDDARRPAPAAELARLEPAEPEPGRDEALPAQPSPLEAAGGGAHTVDSPAAPTRPVEPREPAQEPQPPRGPSAPPEPPLDALHPESPAPAARLPPAVPLSSSQGETGPEDARVIALRRFLDAAIRLGEQHAG